MKIGVVAFAGTILLLSVSCDTISGVQRTAVISELPPARVEQVISRVPGVTNVRRDHVPESVAWSLYEGKIVSPPYDQYLYDAGAVGGVVIFRRTPEGRNEVEISYWWLGRMPARTADEARRVMDAVYEALRSEFSGLPEKSAVQETLLRVDR